MAITKYLRSFVILTSEFYVAVTILGYVLLKDILNTRKMVENAANFTFTSHNKPSIFEIIAQRSLNETLHPALQKLALFLTSLSPEKFNWLNNYYEETFLVLSGILQYHYFKYYDASFSENFYGLRRVVMKTEERLTDRHRIISIIYIVLLPYLKRKLEAKLTIYRLQHAEGSLGKDASSWFRRFLLIFHSGFEVTWGTWTMLNYLRYMAGQEESQLPLLKLINLKLVYNEDQSNFSFWTAIMMGNLKLTDLNSDLLRNAVTSGFELLAFFIQFLQTWNVHVTNYSITALPKVGPPQKDNKANNFQEKCPICRQSWKIPTLVPVSGYVFCFQCILKHLREVQKCPVTNLPARSLDVIRLFDSDR